MTSPIGLFDSGIGGLTVAQQILKVQPGASLIYVADQANVPYGGRPLSEVRNFAEAISEALVLRGCSTIVMACNISSAVALPHVRIRFPDVQTLGMITAGALSANELTQNGRVGVLATEGTVRSGAYTQTLQAINPEIQVMEAPCPEFVPLIEEGDVNDIQAETAACKYLSKLDGFEADTVILGCTHYPLLLPLLQRLRPNIQFLDPAIPTALQLHSDYSDKSDLPNSLHQLYTTGCITHFEEQLASLFPNILHKSQILQACWFNGKIILPAS